MLLRSGGLVWAEAVSYFEAEDSHMLQLRGIECGLISNLMDPKNAGATEKEREVAEVQVLPGCLDQERAAVAARIVELAGCAGD